MQIVITDGYTLNSGDLSWDSIAAHGELTIHERTPPAQIIDRCKDADIVLTNKVPFNRATLEALPKLKCISVLATGYNLIDTAAAREKGVIVSNVPGYGTASVAQHVFALLLELTNAVGLHVDSTRKGEWQRSPDWSYTKQSIIELSGKTLGIIGMGNIGKQVGRIGSAFDMPVLFFNPSKKENRYGRQVDVETVFRESDAISLHAPLKPENQQFVNKALIEQMKRNALLINTARGGLINEADLADALNNNRIAGAALDVLSTEPPSENNPLLKAKNCIITPHNAWMSKEARERILAVTEKNIKAFLEGKPVNVVN
jgi:glycerate dehydrogenase